MRDRQRDQRAQGRTDEIIDLLTTGLVRVASAHALTLEDEGEKDPESPQTSLDLPARSPLSGPAGERPREAAGGSAR